MPLWNFSSMGGTIFLTFSRISLVVGDILGVLLDIWDIHKGRNASSCCGLESRCKLRVPNIYGMMSEARAWQLAPAAAFVRT